MREANVPANGQVIIDRLSVEVWRVSTVRPSLPDAIPRATCFLPHLSLGSAHR